MARLIDDFLEKGFVTPQGELAIRLHELAGLPSRQNDVDRQREGKTRPELVAQLAYEKFLREQLSEFKSALDVNTDEIKNYLRRTTVIVADNVAEYVFVQLGKIKWDVMSEFPCLSPPFRDFWVDMCIPDAITATNGETFHFDVKKHAYHFRAFDTVDAAQEQEYVSLPDKWDEFQIAAVLRMDSYVNLDGRTPWGPNERYYLPIDPHGAALDQPFCIHQNEVADFEQQLASYFLPPTLLTISFLHCKNVEIEENEPDAKLQKARRRRGKEPHVTFKTLNILPMTKILREHGQSSTHGLKTALHICRGHFKNFQDKGLFGKHKGLFWWDSQVRGKATEGVVVKGYAVRALEQHST